MLAIEWSRGVEDAWSKVATLVPKLAAFVAILLIGAIVARIIRRVVLKLMVRLKVDDHARKFGLAEYVERSGRKTSGIIAGLARAIVLFVTVSLAFSVFGTNNPVSRFISSLVAYTPKVIAALVILAVAAMAAKWARSALSGLAKTSGAPPVLATLGVVVIWAIAVFAALDQLQIAPAVTKALLYAALAVITGSAIVAIGGSGIGPMRARWEKSLAKYDEMRAEARDRSNA